MQFKGTVLGLSLLLATPAAFAESNSIGAGLNSIDYADSDYETTVGIELVAGYSFNENFAVEVGYMDWGEADDDVAPVWTISGHSLKIGAKGSLPVNDLVTLFAKGGVHSWDGEVETSNGSLVSEDDGSDIFGAIGVEFNIKENFAISASISRYDVDGSDLNTFGALALYRF